MAEPPRSNDSGVEPERGLRTPTPRWVKMFAVAVGVLFVLAVLLMGLSDGKHGPGRHLSSAVPAGDRAPAVASAVASHGLLGAPR